MAKKRKIRISLFVALLFPLTVSLFDLACNPPPNDLIVMIVRMMKMMMLEIMMLIIMIMKMMMMMMVMMMMFKDDDRMSSRVKLCSEIYWLCGVGWWLRFPTRSLMVGNILEKCKHSICA